MDFTPLYDNIVISVDKKKTVTDAGIHLPETAAPQDKQQLGTVVKTGAGRQMPNGEVVPLLVKDGNRVLFNKFAGIEITYKGEPFLVMKETDILAVIKQ